MRQTAKGWRRLDNAAKIFPSATSRADTKVFRFVTELHEPVDRYLLQQALEETLEDFPSFCCVLKRGLFWYYLEQTERPFTVHEEDAPPCGVLYHDSRSPLFDISYYRNRINVEVYHVLTDGAGALEFLKAITYHYLLLAHADELPDGCSPLDFDASAAQRMADAFSQYYTGKKRASVGIPKPNRAVYHLRGAKTPDWRLKVVEGVVPADRMLAVAREHNVTVTAFVAALMMCAIRDEMQQRDRRQSVVVSIPIDLHKHFPSETVRNFFSVVNIGYCFEGNSGELFDVAAAVRDSLRETMTGEYLQNRLDTLAALEHLAVARVVPLFIKNIVLKQFYLRSEKEYTTTLSNLGQVKLPPELAGYVRRISVFNSTKDLQACLCSYQNSMSICFSSQLLSNDVERRVFRILTGMGIPVQIVTNEVETGKEDATP